MANSTPPGPTLPPKLQVLNQSRIFGRGRLISLGIFVALFLCCLIFSWSTRDAMQSLPFLHSKGVRRPADSQKTLVNLDPWETASTLAQLAVSNEETQYAQEAERLADHEVDQAFASALRKATAQVQTRVLSGEALELSKRVDELQDLVKDDRQQVQDFSPAPGNTGKANNGDAVEDTADDIEIAKAQLSLDSDQLADVQQDLARASGDDRAQIQSELQEHEAAMKKYDGESDTRKQGAVASATRFGTLASRIGAWNSQRSRRALIDQAAKQAQADVVSLTAEHNALEVQANALANAPMTASNTPGLSDQAAKLANIRARSAQRQLLSIYDDRILTQKHLAAVYNKWSAQVQLQHRIVMHLILGSLGQIAFILIGILLCDALVVKLLTRPSLDRRRMQTLRTILQLGLQFIGVLLVALVVFGPPQQMATVIGLVTAGLTVVLQDFIIAFFGWFVLMGKRGVHVGDWVEINGIAGEVTEVGLFRTTLLETGNWTDKGHPTGRRVTLLNSYAIRGQYFNFSTTGQWMWDELSVSVPADENAYAIVESVHEAVIDETEKDARVAELEWKRGSRADGLSQFTADATVNLRPSATGVDILIRYVTRASERAEMRNRLFQRVMAVLHKPAGDEAETPSAS